MPTDISHLILDSLRDFLVEKNIPIPESLGLETVFLQGDLAMDSLDLAIFLLILEEKTGKDPFRQGFRTFVSVADLAALYSAA